jgi:molybdopterin-guanine dinucleotide biosynthesis protein B
MEGLIKELSKRGYRVATIKHSHHAKELDKTGKDSWRHQQAGATISIISSPGAFAVFGEVERELTVEELCTRFIQSAALGGSGGVDLILAEGYKGSGYPKIVVVGDGKWDAADWAEVKAVVSDQRLSPPQAENVPQFQPGDVMGMVTFLEDEFLGRR